MSDKNNDLNLSERQLAISQAYQKVATPNDEGIVEIEGGHKDFFKTVLSGDVTPEMIKKVDDFKADFNIGTAHGHATISQNFLKKHKKVSDVRVEKLQVGRDTIRHNFARETTVTAPGGASSVKHGWITTKYTSGAGNSSAAAYGRVRNHFAELGAAELAKG